MYKNIVLVINILVTLPILNMARGKTLSEVLKSTHENQGMLFPPDLNEMVAANHPVRTIKDILDQIDIFEANEIVNDDWAYKKGYTYGTTIVDIRKEH